MNTNKDLIQKIWPYFLVFFLFNFTGLTLLAYFGKEEMHLYFNKVCRLPFFDYLFKYYTDLATTYLLIALIIFIIIKKNWRHFAYLGTAFIVSSIASVIIKRGLFEHGHRPTFYFEIRKIKLILVEGVESQIPYTFPSGHTLTASILFFYLCLINKNRYLQFLFGFLMALTAVGRVYLSKHFVIDTIGGGFLGIFIATLCYYLIWQSDKSWLNKKIIPKK